MAYCMAVALQKGGGNKTSVTVNISAGFARAGWRVLLVDCDAQGNAGQYLGWDPDGRPTLTNVLLDPPRGLPAVSPSGAIRGTYLERLNLLPASGGLAPADIVLGGQPGWDRRLQMALAPLQDRYDLIVLDTPPNLSTIVTNACVAADGLLIPLPGEAEALAGVRHLLAQLQEWRKFTRAAMPIIGVVRSRWDARRRLERAVQDELANVSELDGLLLDSIIPDQTVVAQAFAARQDVAAFAPSTRAAAAYTELVAELAIRIQARARSEAAPPEAA